MDDVWDEVSGQREEARAEARAEAREARETGRGAGTARAVAPTWCRLGDGSWGVRAARGLAGTIVTVRRRDGTTSAVSLAQETTPGVYALGERNRDRGDRAPARRSYGRSYGRSARGRCEDAPCCGCCE